MRTYPLIRSLLFRLKPEVAHNLTLQVLRVAGGISLINSLLSRTYQASSKPVEVFGIRFANPIGLAAGYDKDGLGWKGLACLGFSHVEIGTVTPRPQAGNPKPRLFRLPEQKALINRMGFPGRGAEFVRQQISIQRPKNLVLGVNIGKNKDTPLETAEQDYLFLLDYFAGYADYLTINVSSPNTVGLRQLQERDALDRLLKSVTEERARILSNGTRTIPLLVKLSPDLTDSQLDDALDVITRNRIDGVIATNTTLAREGVRSPLANEAGGLSGVPIFELSLAMVGKISRRTSGNLPVIGVGGIINATGVLKMMDAGAKLVQIYTGLLYEGPTLIKRILLDLLKLP